MRWLVPRSRMTHAEQVDELAARSTEDWLQPADVFDVARFAGDSDEDAYVERAILLVRDLLSDGLVVAGDVGAEGFKPWGLTVDQSVSQISDSWRSDHDSAPTSFAVWLAATEAGLARGEQALLRARPTDD